MGLLENKYRKRDAVVVVIVFKIRSSDIFARCGQEQRHKLGLVFLVTFANKRIFFKALSHTLPIQVDDELMQIEQLSRIRINSPSECHQLVDSLCLHFPRKHICNSLSPLFQVEDMIVRRIVL